MRTVAADQIAPSTVVEEGMQIGGFRVERVATEHPERWIATEAATTEGLRVRLWISERPASADPGLSAAIDALRGLRAGADLPFVPPVGAGRDNEHWFFAQAPPSKRTLADRLREGPLRPGEAISVLRDLVRALKILRAGGVPHEHLTPARIRLTAGTPPRALLADYGFAPAAGPVAARREVSALAGYLAPEVAGGKPLQSSGDVYALGCIMYECLTGAPPFSYDRPRRVLEAHRSEVPPCASEHADLPPAVDRQLLAALRKHPDERPQSPEDLLRGLQRAFGMPVPASGSAPLRAAPRVVALPQTPAHAGARPAARRSEPPTSDRRRRTTRTTLVAGALLALVTGAGFAIGNSQPNREPAKVDRIGAAARPAATPPSPDVRGVAVTIGRLRGERDAQRRGLQAARTPAAQAAAATALAKAYATARRGLPLAVVETGTGLKLDAALGSTERAYRLLAAAVGSGDASAFGAARAAVLRDERTVDDVLARVSTS